MRVDKTFALYVLAVVEAIGSTLRPEHLTDVCPECGRRQTVVDNDEHLIVVLPSDSPAPRRVAVIVACQGYWVVDPALVGIEAPNWIPDLPTEGL